jgi:plastocyanin
MATTTVEPEARTDAPRSRTWRDALTIALVLDALFCAALLVLIGEPIPPLIVFMVLFAGLAVAVRRTARAWPAIVAVVAGLLFIVGNLPFIVEDLAHPETIAAFVPIFLLTITTVFVMISGVLAARSAASDPMSLGIGFAVVGVLGVLASVGLAGTVEDDVRQAGDVEVVAEDTEYPTEVTVTSGDGLFVDNQDIFRHTFVVDDTDIHHELPGGASRRVTVDLEPGDYTFRCDVPGHERMEGTLVVE